MTLKTLRVYISYTRRALKQLTKLKLSVPPEDFDQEVSMRGNNLVVGGKSYSPRDLDKLAGSAVDFQLPAIEYLESRLEELEFARVAKTGKYDTLEAIDEFTADYAIAGLDIVSREDELAFITWLNTGSDGYKKKIYYHDYGAPTINRGYITGFLEFMGVTSIDELDAATTGRTLS